MSESISDLGLLREVLDNLAHPESLDGHPWVNSRMVAETCRQDPGLAAQSPGRQLVQAVSSQFEKMMPGNPPRRGLRLDTRWGEFGILAAQYFAPYRFDLPYPSSLREAWQSIDRAILLFVFGEGHEISDRDRVDYQLIGDEPEIAPNSTISDWHRKGIEQLSDLLIRHEKHLEFTSSANKPAGKLDGVKSLLTSINPPPAVRKWMGRAGLLLVTTLLALGVFHGVQLYQKAMSIKHQADELLTFSNSLTQLDNIPEVGLRVSQLRKDLADFRNDSDFLFSIFPYLGWIPVYGGDLAQASSLMEMAIQISIAGDEILQVVSPMMDSGDAGQPANILAMLTELKDADAQLLAAQVALANVRAIRQQIQPETLSPRLRQLIIERFDPILNSLDTAIPVTDVLQMARLAPRLLGAVGNGPQTYMILIQNEDELRPTGGFLTAVGLVEIENGRMTSISFESSDRVDDLKKSYPKAPWQLDAYMMAEILLFRDANWFTNFPTTVEWTKFLYAYTRSASVDGVFAIDQNAVREVLKIVGPLDVPGVEAPVTADNVLAYMRSAKQNTPPPGISKKDWDRKQFISWLAEPLVGKLLNVDDQSKLPLSRALLHLLDEKHILLQFNDPEMSALLANRSWDGVVRPVSNADFLMVVDSNVGFNKTSALIKIGLEYALDLSDTNKPLGKLTASFVNPSQVENGIQGECIQAGGDIRDVPLDQRVYIMNDCYWSYLRVYTPALAVLSGGTPQEIPQKWHLREQFIPARIDILDENIPGTQAFGTLLVVPLGETRQTSMTYQLPATIVSFDPGRVEYTYRLKVQKQPGTLEVPINIHLSLPANAEVTSASPGFDEAPDGWVLSTSLRQDVEVEVVFVVPE